MRWFKYSVILVGFLLLLAFLLPFMIPLNSYISFLEKRASEKIGQPVKIAALRFSLLPLPSVTAYGLGIGKEPQSKFETITLRPALGSLFQEVKVLRAVEVKGFQVNSHLLGFVGALAKPVSNEPSLIRLQRIQLRAMQLDLEGLKWGPLRADIELNEQGVQGIEAGSEDGKFKLNLTPGTPTQDVQISAKQWEIPLKTALKFEQLIAQGQLQKNTLNLSNIHGRLYAGKLQGKAIIDWSRGWKARGDLKIQNVETKEIVALMTHSIGVSGKLDAQGSYRLHGKEPTQLLDGLSAQFKFEVRQGVLYGFDLAQAVKTLTRSGTRGGQTRFDALSGTLIITGKQIQLRQLYVASGVLSAHGNVNIAANKQLSGRINVALKGIAGLVDVPLDVSGTVSEPILLPNRAALAGAAAGTAILGPGFGTGMGSKAGQILENIFK